MTGDGDRAEWQRPLAQNVPYRTSSPAASREESEAAMRESLAAEEAGKRAAEQAAKNDGERKRHLHKMRQAMRKVPWVQKLVRLTDRHFSADE